MGKTISIFLPDEGDRAQRTAPPARAATIADTRTIWETSLIIDQRVRTNGKNIGSTAA